MSGPVFRAASEGYNSDKAEWTHFYNTWICRSRLLTGDAVRRYVSYVETKKHMHKTHTCAYASGQHGRSMH